MRGLTLGLFAAFGLAWGVAALAGLALPHLGDNLPAIVGPAASVALDWAQTQTTMAMGLSAVAWLCALTGGRGWAVLGLLAILPLLALAVLQFDPRIQVAAVNAVGPVFNDLRAGLPQIRLGLFVGLALIGAARLLPGGPGGWGPRVVAAGTLFAWAAMVALPGPDAVAAIALPAALLTLVAAVTLADHDSPAAPFVLTGLVCLFAGLLLMFEATSPRRDLRPGYVAFVLLAGLAYRWQPRLPEPVLWAVALVTAAALAYLAPGLQQMGDVRAAATFAEIGAAIARSKALRTGISLLLALWVLLALGLFRRRRHRPPPASTQG